MLTAVLITKETPDEPRKSDVRSLFRSFRFAFLVSIFERRAASYRRRCHFQIVEDKLKMKLANALRPVAVDKPAPLRLPDERLLESDEGPEHDQGGRGAADPSLGEVVVGRKLGEIRRERGQGGLVK